MSNFRLNLSLCEEIINSSWKTTGMAFFFDIVKNYIIYIYIYIYYIILCNLVLFWYYVSLGI
ncbi:MAG: hypothetical protein MCS20_01505 [Candidatus Phytoplasma mali]|nr:hypothetical protein [Candidatus Phytoplasma mali]